MKKPVSKSSLKNLRKICSNNQEDVITSIRHLDKDFHNSYINKFAFSKKEKKEYTKDEKESMSYKSEDFIKEYKKLERKLLSFGGIKVSFPKDLYLNEIKQIVNRGQFWYGNKSEKISGVPGKCHHNSAYTWSNYKDELVLATGFALDSKGTWVCHSWLIEPTDNKSIILETTTKRIAYFGVVLNYEEALNEISYY